MLLNLIDTYRLYLKNKGALDVDKDGNEVLIGLNLSESIEYIDIVNIFMSGRLPGDVNTSLRFLDLFSLHEKALPIQFEPYYLKLARNY